MLRYYELPGPYLSGAAAAYPASTNKGIAQAWARAAVGVEIRTSQSSSMIRTGVWINTFVRAELVTAAKRELDSVPVSLEPVKVRMTVPWRPASAAPVSALHDEKAFLPLWIGGHRALSFQGS